MKSHQPCSVKPGAKASRMPGARFAGFTFDHTLAGMVVGCRRDNKELFAIVVANNRVRQKVLRSADPGYLDYAPLPYETAIDRERSQRQRRRRPAASGSVIPFPPGA